MARIWQEGFEDGLPNYDYLEGSPNSAHIKGIYTTSPERISLIAGRNSFSQYALNIEGVTAQEEGFVKVLTSEISEGYIRMYYNRNSSKTNSTNSTYVARLCGRDQSLTRLFSITYSASNTYTLKVRIGGTETTIGTFTMLPDMWHKVEFYWKASATVGAYELKVDNVSEYSDSGINTGTDNLKSILSGVVYSAYTLGYAIDDLAINDTSGSVNNSWCGDGTIVSLKPNGAGNYSQWDTCEGYAKGEAGTNTTNITITGHGLATNDVIYNKTRDEYRIVTVVDANNLTVASITGQTTGDVILMYDYQATITNTIGTTTADDKYVVLVGHTLESNDVFVNTTRSNAIRRVIYTSGDAVYNYLDVTPVPPNALGSVISTQYDGDSIKTFKFKPYAITNHWEAVSNQTDPSPKLSYIKTTTLNDIDTFDMEELVADKSLPATTTIIALSHNTYAKEGGAGSEYKPVFRISSTDYAGDTISLSDGALQYQKIYEQSPATSSTWTVAEVDGLEAGVKAV